MSNKPIKVNKMAVPTDLVYEVEPTDEYIKSLETRIHDLEAILDLDPRTNISIVNENIQLRNKIKELEKDNEYLNSLSLKRFSKIKAYEKELNEIKEYISTRKAIKKAFGVNNEQ